MRVPYLSTGGKGICSSRIDSADGAEHLWNMSHTYRIEVWDEEETEILEEISVATDNTVSQAAWHAALRVRPGFLLIHKNGTHVMDKLVTPGDRPPDGRLERSYAKGLKGMDILLSDLRHWHQVTAFCAVCVRNAVIETDALKGRFGESASFGQIERKLVCRQCGRRDTVRLSVTKAPRD